MTEETPSSTPTTSEPKKKPIYTRPKFILSMICAVIFLILIFQNWDAVDIRIFFWKQEAIPAAIPYLLFSLIGFVVGWLVRKPKKPFKE
jgi:uncharacterized integral membrane protein